MGMLPIPLLEHCGDSHDHETLCSHRSATLGNRRNASPSHLVCSVFAFSR